MSAQPVDVLARYTRTPGGRNVVLACDGFAVSYNPDPGAMGFSCFAGDNGSDETAIVVGGEFFILNGDFRREYAELSDSGGLDACLHFFASKPDLVSSWSGSVDAALARCDGGRHAR